MFRSENQFSHIIPHPFVPSRLHVSSVLAPSQGGGLRRLSAERPLETSDPQSLRGTETETADPRDRAALFLFEKISTFFSHALGFGRVGGLTKDGEGALIAICYLMFYWCFGLSCYFTHAAHSTPSLLLDQVKTCPESIYVYVCASLHRDQTPQGRV